MLNALGLNISELYIFPKYAAQLALEVRTNKEPTKAKSYADYFIYYQNKKPVGIAQVIRGGGYSAIYWVGVLEEYRKKGLGAELTKQTLNYEIARKRYKFLLTASELGLKIYKKLGFKPLETFYEYELKR